MSLHKTHICVVKSLVKITAVSWHSLRRFIKPAPGAYLPPNRGNVKICKLARTGIRSRTRGICFRAVLVDVSFRCPVLVRGGFQVERNGAKPNGSVDDLCTSIKVSRSLKTGPPKSLSRDSHTLKFVVSRKNVYYLILCSN